MRNRISPLKIDKVKKLMILFLIIGCGKNHDSSNVNIESYYMNATINSKVWKSSDLERANFRAEFNPGKNRFTILVTGGNEDPNSICRSIFINFDFVPKVGRYYFDNIADRQKDSGTIAIFTYLNSYGNPVNKWSTGGYVDIESITKDSVKGSFSFTSKGDISDSSTTTISAGSFLAQYAGSGGLPWPGP